MSCKPGMPCFGQVSKKDHNKCNVEPVSSDNVQYSGSNLSCLGIETCDTLTEALQKIDELICSDEFVAAILQRIFNNTELKAYFCQLVGQCATPITTSTSTLVPITTTTTTTIYSPQCGLLGIAENVTPITTTTSTTVTLNCALLGQATEL